MQVSRIEHFIGGWFIGDFKPSVFRTKDFEVCYKKHTKGERWEKHYHKIAKEINYLISGRMLINDTLLRDGDVFTINPREVSNPKFLTDCELIVVKIPSVKKDKYEVL